MKSEELIVETIKDFSKHKQAELIADRFASISQEYEKLEEKDIEVPFYTESDIPAVWFNEVLSALEKLDTNKSNVEGDVPAKKLKHFARQVAKPFSNIINASVRQGIWPNIFKVESVTPVPKVFPPNNIDDLRNISGLLNLNKIAEKIISKMLIEDMRESLDPSQYANQKGLSIQHYLVKIIDKILLSLEKNSKSDTCAVLATLVDWKQADCID